MIMHFCDPALEEGAKRSMVDMSLIAGTLAHVKTGIDIGKLLRDSRIKLKDAEIDSKIADLINALSDAKVSLSDIKILLMEREETIVSLNKKLEIKENIVWEDPYYIIPDKEGNKGPYCQKCYDNDSKLIRLQRDTNYKGWWICCVCNITFYTKNAERYDNDISMVKMGRF